MHTLSKDRLLLWKRKDSCFDSALVEMLICFLFSFHSMQRLAQSWLAYISPTRSRLSRLKNTQPVPCDRSRHAWYNFRHVQVHKNLTLRCFWHLFPVARSLRRNKLWPSLQAEAVAWVTVRPKVTNKTQSQHGCADTLPSISRALTANRRVMPCHRNKIK